MHTFTVKLIAHNEEAESLIKIHKEEINVKKDQKDLKFHFEVMGLYSNEMTKYDLDLKILTYMGENKLTMLWVEF